MLRSPSPSVVAKSEKPLIALFPFLLLLSLFAACQPKTTDTHAADETALKNQDSEWSKAAGAKDVAKTVSYYADDAIVMPPNSPLLTGKEPIRELWKGMLGTPGFAAGWKSTKVEVAKSGDLGYVIGSYEFTENDSRGKPMTDKGKFAEVWKKQADGNWKCVVDIFNSDGSTTPAKNKPRQPKKLG
ncbi:MAG TPA: DUF4440 domain-containing protein [Pyrinomonadaceae bacterium]